MTNRRGSPRRPRAGLCASCAAAVLVAAALIVPARAQDRLPSMPGHAQYSRMASRLAGALRPGAITVAWSGDSRSFEYSWDGRRYRYDVRSRAASEIAAPADLSEPGGRGGRGRLATPERGRQYTSAESPDGRWVARFDETTRNLHLMDTGARREVQITTDGGPGTRIKYGTASWVYGEELGQTTAMWWSPDGRRLAFYRFDETAVPDYYVALNQTKVQSTIDVEAYPKAGAPNPVVDVLVYDVQTRQTARIDVRGGRPFDESAVGHYVYAVAWAPDGRELLFHRTNRRQNVLELAAADPVTGRVRVVVRDEWPSGWVENTPAMAFLADGRRFVWASERTGWRNFYLYDLDGTLIAPLTTHASFEAASLVKIDEKANLLFYTARSGDNHMKLQLHRVGLDGRGDTRLTDPAYHHTIGSCLPAAEVRRGPAERRPGGGSCAIAPNNAWFVDVYQRHDVPPASRLVDAATGAVAGEILASDTARYRELGLRHAELFTFTAADGETLLHGLVQFPSDFDPARRYPVLVPVYGGPGASSHTARETFVSHSAITEYGFLLVTLDSRAAPGRGKRPLDQLYLKLGQVEVDDIAAGVRALAARPYVDARRVGIYGTSYGGYTALMSILRHPDVYAAASASSPVTAWQHYDTIYTERYMWTPEGNAAGYAAGSAMTHAAKLRGRLMLYYGTADNNVHPANTLQLVAALQAAGKSFDLQVGPDRGHSGINQDRMMEFFLEHLVMRAPAPASAF